MLVGQLNKDDPGNSNDWLLLAMLQTCLSSLEPPWLSRKVHFRIRNRIPHLARPFCIVLPPQQQVLTVESAAALRWEKSFEHPFDIFFVCGEIIKGSEFLYFRMYFFSDNFIKYSMCRSQVTGAFHIF